MHAETEYRILVIGSDDDRGKEFGYLEESGVPRAVVEAVYRDVFMPLYSETRRLQPGIAYARLRVGDDAVVVLGASEVCRSRGGRESLRLRCALLAEADLERVDWQPFRLDPSLWGRLLEPAMGRRLPTARASVDALDVEQAVEALAAGSPAVLRSPRNPMGVLHAAFERLLPRQRARVAGFCTSWPDERVPPPNHFGLCYATGVADEDVLPGRPAAPPDQRDGPEPIRPRRGISLGSVNAEQVHRLFWEFRVWRLAEEIQDVIRHVESDSLPACRPAQLLERADLNAVSLRRAMEALSGSPSLVVPWESVEDVLRYYHRWRPRQRGSLLDSWRHRLSSARPRMILLSLLAALLLVATITWLVASREPAGQGRPASSVHRVVKQAPEVRPAVRRR